VPVITTSELSPGAMKWFVVDRERVLLANVEGVFYAIRMPVVIDWRRCRKGGSKATSSSARCTSRRSTCAPANC